MGDERITITEKDLEKFRQLGLINEIRLRDIYLIREYRKRVKENPAMKKYKIREDIVTNFNEMQRKLNTGHYITEETLYDVISNGRYIAKMREPLIKELL